jgi:putative endonuclease
MTEGWGVYIIQSQKTGHLYTGVTNDMSRRLKAHNDGSGARRTRGQGPWRLVYWEARKDRGEALRREHAIKRMTRAAKLQLTSRP